MPYGYPVAPLPAPTRPLLRHSSPGLFFDAVHGIRTVHINANLSDPDFERLVQLMGDDIDQRTGEQAMCVLYEVPDMGLTHERRLVVGRVLRERAQKLAELTKAYALVTPSYVVRGVLQAIWWLAPPGYPWAVRPDLESAFAFLAQHDSAIDAVAALAAYRQTLVQHPWVGVPW